jgi:hypothetical protein
MDLWPEMEADVASSGRKTAARRIIRVVYLAKISLSVSLIAVAQDHDHSTVVYISREPWLYVTKHSI